MDRRSPATDHLRPLIGSGAATNPRAPQLGFFVPATVPFLFLAVTAPESLSAWQALTSGLLLIAATLAAVLLPWRRWHPRYVLLLPALDILAIGILQLTPGAAAAWALAVIPAMWLGTVYRFEGVLLATLATVAFVSLPSLIATDQFTLRALLSPLIAFAVAHSLCVTADIWSDQRTAMEVQGAHLARVLTENHRHQQISDAVLAAADVGIMALDPSGEILLINPRQEAINRLARPDGGPPVRGETPTTFRDDGVTPLPYDEHASVRARRGDTFSGLTVWVGSDPVTRRAFSISARSITDEHGDLSGSVLAYQDITDLMHALRIKDQFVANVSHELRTPLTSIMGYSEILRDSLEPEHAPAGNALVVIERNAQRLLELVSDLLTTAQAGSGGLRIQRDWFRAADVVSGCVEAIAPRAGASEISLDVRLDPDLQLYADAERFGRVVEKLLSNAVLYNRPGGTVEVTMASYGDVLELQVKDTGVGMTPEEVDSVFTPFYRAESAVDDAVQGMGLGLSIAKALVVAHAGVIDVSSVEGQGTAVRVRLPVGPSDR